MNENTVNRKCKYFKCPTKCALIQPDGNCYQCLIVRYEINKKDLSMMRERLDKLEEENKTLKILLADKLITENKDLASPEERNKK